MTNKICYSLAAVIILITSFLAISSAWNDSVVFDEVPYISGGYSYLTHQEMRINPEHPTLFKDLAALPLMFENIHNDVFQTPSWTTNINDQWQFGKIFLFASGNDAQLITRSARIPMILFFILAALVVLRWTQKLYDNKVGLIALVFFCFSPTILGHARYVTNDVAVLCGVVTALYFFVRFLKSPSTKNVWIAGLALGFALVTKLSSVILLPFLVMIVFLYVVIHRGWSFKGFKEYGLKLFWIYAIALFLIIYPLYTFQIAHFAPALQKAETEAILGRELPIFKPVIWSADKTLLRPLSQYALGVSMNTIRTAGGNTFFYFGKVSTKAHLSYFPVVYGIKEALPWLILLIGSLLASLAFWVQDIKRKSFHVMAFVRHHIDESVMLAWVLLFGAISVLGNLNIGIRHILPLFPFLIILGVAAARYAYLCLPRINMSFQYYARIILGVLLTWVILETFFAFPSYLSYYNELIGGSANGYKYVTDSNTDWGQDLVRLDTWLSDHQIAKAESDVFTSADPSYYLGSKFIPLWRDKYASKEDFIKRSQTPWMAISVNTLEDAWATHSGYEWLRNVTPSARIEDSIFIYRVY